MDCSHCGVCCTETEMLLCKEDIKRLQKKGYNKKYFLRYDKAGYAMLRNRNGYCVFYDLEKHRCSVYVDKPQGCTVYPVILDVEVGIIIDGICNAQSTISDEEKAEKGKIVIKLLQKIDSENKRVKKL
jgi:uncharacterized protein